MYDIAGNDARQPSRLVCSRKFSFNEQYHLLRFKSVSSGMVFFFTFLHSKSKKKVNDEKLDTDEKLPNN